MTIAVVAFAAYLTALLLRFDGDYTEIFVENRLFDPLVLLVVARTVTYITSGVLESSWRFISTSDVFQIFKIHLASSFVFAASVLLFRVEQFPRSVVFVEFLISFIATLAVRMGLRTLFERVRARELGSLAAQEVIVLGAGDSGHLLIRMLKGQGRAHYIPVGVLDDSERMQNTSVHGVQVIGRIFDLETALSRHKAVTAVIVAIPTLSAGKYMKIDRVCRARKVSLKRIQSFEDIAVSDAFEESSRVSVEAILKRDFSFIPDPRVAELISKRRVLVTGAGGSIGSELVRQIAALAPSKLVLLDNSEFNLYRINLELGQRFPSLSVPAILGDIRDRNRMRSVFEAERPEVIFHAAAYKHVPLTELNPSEAFLTNVIGTKVVLDEACRIGVKRFVLISTDKAVRPVNVLGFTKRLAEELVTSTASPSDVIVSAVRFGNVINSTGSVIPLFREQIIGGGPVTVTHPDVERYFMSVQESVRLVLSAATLEVHGARYMLDMGAKVKIVDVARRMLELYQRENIPIVFTGLRPGERISEQIVEHDERIEETAINKVSRIRSDRLINGLALLTALANPGKSTTNEGALQLMKELMDCIGISSSYLTADMLQLEARDVVGA